MSTKDHPKKMKAEQLPRQPGKQHEMEQQPVSSTPEYKGSGKLKGKVAIITGGDSGIGRAVAIAFAKEGAHIAICHFNENKDAAETKRLVEKHGGRCLVHSGDIGKPITSKDLVRQTVTDLGGVDIIVNNAAEQHVHETIEDITPEELERTFQTNIFGMFYLVQAALSHLKNGSTIINTASIVAYQGHPKLLPYASTKGAIIAFTRSLSSMLVPQGIRVNAVAPGPIWTPLIPATFPEEKVETFGKNTPMQRPGQPEEVAPAFVYLASNDSSYISGQTIHVNGGTIVNG